MSLRALRRKQGWSQEELAAVSDLSVRTIQRIEAGHPAGLEARKALASAFGLSVEQLAEALGEMAEMPAFFNSPGARRWAPLFWHAMVFLSVMVALALIVARLDASPRIAAGLGMLWGGVLLVQLALTLARSRPA